MSEAFRGRMEELRRETGLNSHKEAHTRRQVTDGRIVCSTPLAQQIEDLMRSLPRAQTDRPWSMHELVARLHGKYNLCPCSGEVGLALRSLGWTQTRNWSPEGGGRRVWMKSKERRYPD